jgi:hypothetical protein
VPRCSSRIRYTIDRPSPLPGACIPGARWKRRPMFARSSADRPSPASVIRTTAFSPADSIRTATVVAGGLDRRALSIRFLNRIARSPTSPGPTRAVDAPARRPFPSQGRLAPDR